MARGRGYPGLGLNEAIRLAKLLYEKAGKAPNTAEGIVKAWGYGGMHGKSGRVLSALRQYGLIEARANEMLALSQRALTILLEPESSEERVDATLAAAMEPAVFAEILQEFPDGLPGDDGLVSYLVRKQDFSHDSAELLVAVLRDTMALVDSIKQRYNGASGGAKPANERGETPPEKPRTPPPPGGSMPEIQTEHARPFDLPIPLAAGTATLRIPVPMTADDFELLTEAIALNLKLYRANLTKKPEPPAAEPQDAP